jgi:hypothetical protein
MKPIVPKIIIKPRLPPAQPVAGTSSRLITAAPPTPEAETPQTENGTEGDGEGSQTMDVDGAEESMQTGDEGGSRVGTPRPRGRPRGRGRGLSTGVNTPRARGRGRGRGRARGGRGALTIRLPKRGDEDGDTGADGDVEREGTTEAEAVEGEGTHEEGEGPKEKEGPLGGGKPFRKIQGKVYIIEGDEFITDNDPKGDEKIDNSGHLLGSAFYPQLYACAHKCSLVQAVVSKHRYSCSLTAILPDNTCLLSMLPGRLGSATRSIISDEIFSPSSSTRHNPKKTISSPKGNSAHIFGRAASRSSPHVVHSSFTGVKW